MRRILMIKEIVDNDKEFSKDKEIVKFKKVLVDVQKENNFLKKWEGYLKE